jgi:hypothetical protein
MLKNLRVSKILTYQIMKKLLINSLSYTFTKIQSNENLRIKNNLP